MIIDLHVHTRQLSYDSEVDVEEAIQEAKRIGLDCICLTDHNKSWDRDHVQELSTKWDFPVMCGVEVDTAEGHILVFGIQSNFDRVIPARELRDLVLEEGGIMIAAHPFRGFLSFGTNVLDLFPEQAFAKPVLQYVDIIEGFNGSSFTRENHLTLEVAERLSLKTIGGSDAHAIDRIGRCVTIFDNEVHDETELIRELRTGNYKPGVMVDGTAVNGYDGFMRAPRLLK
ncbi:MAG: PHP domain-containing protein [Chloroflexota bacterium]|nr:PHP domain-containing protein [Chloroflexota bacterium]